MDTGKLEALKKVNWKPVKSCGTCHFGVFAPGQEWGTCGVLSNDYIHNKHDRKHSLPAHKQAVCDKYCIGTGARDQLIDFLNSPVTS